MNYIHDILVYDIYTGYTSIWYVYRIYDFTTLIEFLEHTIKVWEININKFFKIKLLIVRRFNIYIYIYIYIYMSVCI